MCNKNKTNESLECYCVATLKNYLKNLFNLITGSKVFINNFKTEVEVLA